MTGSRKFARKKKKKKKKKKKGKKNRNAFLCWLFFSTASR